MNDDNFDCGLGDSLNFWLLLLFYMKIIFAFLKFKASTEKEEPRLPCERT